MFGKKKKRLFLLYAAGCLSGMGSVFAQDLEKNSAGAWSLEKCMSYAVENSTRVKKQQYVNDNYRQRRRSAVASLLPSLSASVGGDVTTGRGIDPETNTYSTISNFGNSYGVYASIPLFNGFALINKVIEAKMAIRSGRSELQQVKDDICLSTMKSYYDAVYYRMAMGIARNKLEESRQNVYKTKKMEELGLTSEADVAQMSAILMSDNYLLVQQEAQYMTALMALKDNMNFPLDDSLAVDTVVSVQLAPLEYTSEQVYEKALATNPQVIESYYQSKIKKLQYSQARGRMFPSLSLSGGYSTNYYTNLTGDRSQVKPFNTQFDENKGGYVRFSLSIPIFSGLSRRTDFRIARNAMYIAEQDDFDARRRLRSDVESAILARNSRAKQYYLARQQVEADALAYKAILRKYEEGVSSSLDVRTSANTLMESRVRELEAYLQYLIKCRTVDYYNGVPLISQERDDIN